MAEPLSERFTAALVQAATWHASQRRKRDDRVVPYISHLLATAALVLEDGGDEDQAIAGLLHDSMEDQGITEGTIEAMFGPEVARIVVACSDYIGPQGGPKPPWLERKSHHLAALAEASAAADAGGPPEAEAAADIAVLRVTAADKLHNCRDIVGDVRIEGPVRLDRFRGGIQGTCWYFAAMSALLEDKLPESRLTDDLAREARTLHELAGVTWPAARPDS